MKKSLSLAVPALLVLSGCSTLGIGGLKPNAAILSESEGTKILAPCSRPAPSFDGRWQPSVPEGELVSANLHKLRGFRDSAGRTLRPLSEYVYQYTGIGQGGVPRIYVHAVVPPPGDAAAPAPLTAMRMCDGGNRSFGAVFDPTTRTFSDIRIDGTLAGPKAR